LQEHATHTSYANHVNSSVRHEELDMKHHSLIFIILFGLALANPAIAASQGELHLTPSQETLLTESETIARICPDKGEPALAAARVEWKNLALKRGDRISGVPVDLSVEFNPMFGAKSGDVVMSAIEILSGQLIVDPSGRAETWSIQQGNFGNQSARSNFNIATGNLHLILPVILDNGAGVRAGVNLVAICSYLESGWQCTKGSVTLEEMRRASEPNADIDDVLRHWVPSAYEGASNANATPGSARSRDAAWDHPGANASMAP
jgi:hypothetical protein